MNADINNSLGIIGIGKIAKGLIKLCIREGIRPVVLLRDKGKIGLIGEEFLHYQKIKFPDRPFVYLKFTEKKEDLAFCNLVIEAIDENFIQKVAVYTWLKKVIGKNTPVGTTTSSLRINTLARAGGLETQLIGLHFFNPPQVIHFLEIIPAKRFAPTLLSQVIAFIKLIKYDYIQIPDLPGGVANRILFSAILAAVELRVKKHIAEEKIDTIIKQSLKHQLGPFELLDLIGIETADTIVKNLFRNTKELLLWEEYYKNNKNEK